MNPETDDLDLLEGLEEAPVADDVENDDPAPQPNPEFEALVEEQVERRLALYDRVAQRANSQVQAPVQQPVDDDDVEFDWVDPNASLRKLKAEIRELKSQKTDPTEYLEVYGAKQEASALVDSIATEYGVPANIVEAIKEQIRNAPVQQSNPQALKAFAEAFAKAAALDALKSRPAPRVNRNSYGGEVAVTDVRGELARYPRADREFLIRQHENMFGKRPTANELLDYLKAGDI